MARRRPSRGRRRADAPAEEPITRGEGVGVAPTGEGVVKLPDGRRLLVPGVLPGERIMLHPAGRRGRLTSVVVASEDRVSPSCPAYERCGGCNAMHASNEAQAKHHAATVQELLAHAGLGPLPAATIHRPTAPFGYRDRARLTVEARGGQARVGFRRARSKRVTSLEACPVFHPDLAPIWAELADALHGSDGRGEARVSAGLDGRVVDLHWSGTLAPKLYGAADRLVGEGAWAGMSLWHDDPRKPAVFGDPRPRTRGHDGEPLRLPAGGFAQASAEGGAALARRVAELIEPRGRLVELFAGSGTLSTALAGHVERFEAVEQVAEAAACLRENLAARDLTGKTHVRDANAFTIPRPVATVVLDPPRAGAPGAIEAIAASRVGTVVYVSCNPVTLARDLGVLAKASYRLDTLDLFELFPQTHHVETVVRMRRGDA